MPDKSDSKRLAGEVQVFLLRVATAELKLKLLHEEHLHAKRRRKEVKRLAQRARKAFKQCKNDFGELKQTLARTEAKLLQADRHAPAKKTAKDRSVAKGTGRLAKKSTPSIRRASPPATRTTGRAARKNPPPHDSRESGRSGNSGRWHRT